MSQCRDHQHEEPCPVCAADADVPLPPVRERTPVSVPISDREMWTMIRASILAIVKALEEHGQDKPLATATRAALLGMSAAIEMRWGFKKQKVI
jgi:hypothetical protein